MNEWVNDVVEVRGGFGGLRSSLQELGWSLVVGNGGALSSNGSQNKLHSK